MSIEAKLEKDLKSITEIIMKSPQKDNVIKMFKKGPPKNEGFMWCSKEGGQGYYWSEEEAAALKMVSNLVFKYQWDSSGYAFMMRAIQCHFINSK